MGNTCTSDGSNEEDDEGEYSSNLRTISATCSSSYYTALSPNETLTLTSTPTPAHFVTDLTDDSIDVVDLTAIDDDDDKTDNMHVARASSNASKRQIHNPYSISKKQKPLRSNHDEGAFQNTNMSNGFWNMSDSVQAIVSPTATQSAPPNKFEHCGSIGQAQNCSSGASLVYPRILSSEVAKRPKNATLNSLIGNLLDDTDSMPKCGRDRFFAALLRSNAAEYIQSTTCAVESQKLWWLLLQRLDLLVVEQRLKPQYDNSVTHFELRASLVVEEAKAQLAASLTRFFNSKPSIDVSLLNVKEDKYNVCFLTFRKQSGYFSTAEFSTLFRDNIVHIKGCNIHGMLGIIERFNQSDKASRQFIVKVFVTSDNLNKFVGNSWIVTVLDNYISPYRRFQACIYLSLQPQSFPFLRGLLKNNTCDDQDQTGTKSNEHIQKYTKPLISDSNNKYSYLVGKEDNNSIKIDSNIQIFKTNKMNETQELAAATFHHSQPSSITIVQGPPGTGKTTLLVSIICQYIEESKRKADQRRLMVSAPTNKAVSVVASRFMASVLDPLDDSFSAIIFGNEEKLLDSDSELRSIYAPTWMKFTLSAFDELASFYDVDCELSTQQKQKFANRLIKRVSRCLKNLPTKLENELNDLQLLTNSPNLDFDADEEIHSCINCIKLELGTLAEEVVLRELMRSADVVFCTLCSSGSNTLSSIDYIDDLIVDEAAAAIEPDIYIPLRLGPSRLLIVGDPMQLPATIVSECAARFGLDESLHERLMYKCKHPYIVLDVQYRMHPSISTFPSKEFYEGMIKDSLHLTSRIFKNRSDTFEYKPYAFVDIVGEEKVSFTGSMSNEKEAAAVVNIVSALVPNKSKESCSADFFRIITFYQDQANLIDEKLKEAGYRYVQVNTVDSAQGCESDIVIISFVRSVAETAGFLCDIRRINVALTRARYQLICVGNLKRLETIKQANADVLRKLAKDALERRIVLPFGALSVKQATPKLYFQTALEYDKSIF